MGKVSCLGVFLHPHVLATSGCCDVFMRHCISTLKGNSHQKKYLANMIELLLKSFLVYHLPIFEAWKVTKRPDGVSCDIMPHLVAYQTAVETRTNSSGMRTHTGQRSRLPCVHTLIFAVLVRSI